MPPTLSIMRLYDDDPTLPVPAWYQFMRQSTDFAGVHSQKMSFRTRAIHEFGITTPKPLFIVEFPLTLGLPHSDGVGRNGRRGGLSPAQHRTE